MMVTGGDIMNICGCRTKCDCTLFAVIASVIVGIVTAFLSFSATLAVPSFVYWIFFGVALVLLAVALVTAPFICRSKENFCLCTSLNTFLAGVFGTVLFSLVLLLIDLTAGLLFSLLTGLLFGLFTLTITSVACIIKNIADC